MLSCIAALLTACSERVSVGVWDVEISSADGLETAVWTITDPGGITMAGGTVVSADEVDLVGSRINWASGTANPDDRSAPSQRMTFTGTVNGDTLSGTIYTTEGNKNVSGTRR